MDTLKYSKLKHRTQRLGYLRALAINSLIKDAVRVFTENETDILNGSFGSALLERSQYKAQIKDIIDLSIEKIYCSEEVIQKNRGLQSNHHLVGCFCLCCLQCFFKSR